MISIPSATSDIGEMLSSQYANQRKSNTQALLQIFICIKFLCRLGLALRGDGTEFDGNLQQLLRMKAHSGLRESRMSPIYRMRSSS